MLIEDVKDALRAGVRCVFDARLWRDMVVALFSWAALGKAILAIVAIVISLPLLVLLPPYISWAPGFLVAAWVGSSIMRRTGWIIASRALVAAPARGAGSSQPLPPPGTYFVWWLPLLFCSAILPQAVAAMPWGDSHVVLFALLVVQVAVAPGAVVRNVLAPRFLVATMDAALRRRRGFWTLVAFAYLLALGALQWLTSLASAGGLGGLLSALLAWDAHRLTEYLLVRTAIWLALFLVVAVFCTAVLARFALTTLARSDGSYSPVAVPEPDQMPEGKPTGAPTDTAPPAPERPPEPPRTWTASSTWLATAPKRARVAPPAPAPAPSHAPPRTPRYTWVAALLMLLGGAIWFRGELVYSLLGDDFHTVADSTGPWIEPGVRQHARWATACAGDARTLRTLAWAGIVDGGNSSESALACAAVHGHLEAVKALAAAGDDLDRPAKPLDGVAGAALQTPLQQAVRTPQGLPVADWLLAHGARRDPATAGGPDPVQVAAAANCLPCLTWLHQHGFAMNATSPATPLALWFDNRAQRDHDGAEALTPLLQLGLSPGAVGADGRSALHAAAAAGNGAAVHALLALGADPALVDQDGMKPVFYAAAPLGPVDAAASAELQALRARRVAVVAELVGATPSLDGRGTPAKPRRPFIDTDPYIARPYAFGSTGANDASIRSAAAQAGKAIHYTEGDFIVHLPVDEARAMLARMDDAEIATVLARPSPLTVHATEAGWWPELTRAMHGWPRPKEMRDTWPACKLLGRAAAGEDDASSGRSQSWAAVDAWLDDGMDPSDCGALEQGEVEELVTRRSRAQQVDWVTRLQAVGAAPRR